MKENWMDGKIIWKSYNILKANKEREHCNLYRECSLFFCYFLPYLGSSVAFRKLMSSKETENRS